MSVKDQIISVVVPCYNEEEVINNCHDRIRGVFDKLDYQLEMIFINDGSRDKTASLIMDICEKHKDVIFIDFSRNFGKEAAMSAGIEAATGDAVIVLDADLQDPPELIPQFVEKWEEGFDNIYGKRLEREGETWVKKKTASMFYSVIKSMSHIDIPQNAGDFRLLSRQAVKALVELPESHRFMKGLFAWVGFNTTHIEYNRHSRVAGETKWNYWQLWNFALEGITSFTTLPLRVASYLGVFISFVSFIYAIFIIIRTMLHGIDVDGYASQMVIMLFLGGLQLASLGIIGEYVGRIYGETKNRPLYLVKRVINLPKKQ